MNKMRLLPLICALATLMFCLPLLAGCSSGNAAQNTEDQTGGGQAASGQEAQKPDDSSALLIAAAKDAGKIVVTGTCNIYTGAELASIQNIDAKMATGDDGEGSTYVVIQFDEPITLNIASSGDMGNLHEDTATMVCVAYDEPQWDVSSGDVSFWENVAGKNVTIALEPTETWWPSDVSLPVGEPRTSTAEFIIAS